MTLTPLAAYEHVLAELRRKENQAIASNKPTMWAYYVEMTEALTYWIGRASGGTDNGVVGACTRRIWEAEQLTQRADAHPNELAHTWALSVYCVKILRLCNQGKLVTKRSLAWLRARRRWSIRQERERAAA